MPAWKICFLINLLVCTSALCQEKHGDTTKGKLILFADRPDTSLAKQLLLPGANTATQPFRSSIQILPKEFYYNSIGFFCKKELQLEKSAKLPLKIRLGNVSYTDRMEGKGQLPPQKFRKD